MRLTKVEKRFNTDRIIGPISLDFPKGELTSIIGPNGAGKTTSLLMMGRLLAMDSGHITVSGLDIDNTPSEELAKVLAILRQENHFATRLTVRQLVSFGRYPYSKGRLTAEDEAIITKYIHYLGLAPLENLYLHELSGGQRQRTYVAMVLAQETDYILLDEPLNNLDIAASVQMMNYLREMTTQLSRTIIVVIHDLNMAAKYSDNLCLMKDGQVTHFGKVEEMMQSALLSDLYNASIQVIDGPDGPIAIY